MEYIKWTPMASGFQLDSADGKSQEETRGTEKSRAREFIYQVSLWEVTLNLPCALTEGHQATCSNQLCLIPGSSEHFFLLLKQGVGIAWLLLALAYLSFSLFVTSPFINKPLKIILICV